MQMYGKFEGFPLNRALVGLVSYNDPLKKLDRKKFELESYMVHSMAPKRRKSSRPNKTRPARKGCPHFKGAVKLSISSTPKVWTF